MKKLTPYTDAIPEPTDDTPNGEHVGHFRIIVFDQHNDDGEVRFGVDIQLSPTHANHFANYVAKDDRLFAIFEHIFRIAIRKRLSNEFDQLVEFLSGIVGDDDNPFKRMKPRNTGPFGNINKIPDEMNPEQFAALMREAFNGSTCDCDDCRAVRERRKREQPRNTDPDKN